MNNDRSHRCGKSLHFFPRFFFIFYPHFFSFMVVWGLVFWNGVLNWVSGVMVFLDGVWGLWCGAFWIFRGSGFLYKHRRINPGIKMVCGK